MSDTITSLPTAASIDATQDWLAIDTYSVTTTQKINRNTLLGLSSAPVGLSDSQTLTNKTLTSPTISGPTLSGTVSGTYTIGGTPTFPSSVVTLSGTQTLTNKTLTSPTINSPTITNATISADTLSGYTTSNSGTVYGISVTTGTIGSAALASNAVVTAAVADNNITASKLATNAITLGYTAVTNTSGTTTNTTPTAIAAFSTAVTIPSGGRKVKITVYIPLLYNSTSGDYTFLTLWSGTVGTGTGLNYAQILSAGSNNGGPCTLQFVHTPSAGSITYNVGIHANAGTAGWQSNAFSYGTAFLLVEAI